MIENIFLESVFASDVWKLGIILLATFLVGLLGGFTTYSAFSIETINMIMSGFYGRASAYVAATVAVCLMGTWVGITLGRSV